MRLRNSTAVGLVLAAGVGALVAGWPVLAQQASNEPPPPWAQGRPSANIQLAPVTPPPLAAAADKVPVDKLKVPKGFKVEVYASGIPNARSLRLGDKGTVFVSNRTLDKLYAIVDKGGKREVKVIAKDLYRPNGIALHDGTLYIAELSQISKIDKIEDNLDNTPKPTVIYSDLPKDEPHGWKYLTVGPDSGAEVVARGVRQIVGMDWHPTLKQLYFTENARDWLSEELPNDKLNRLTQPGKDNFGYPYCHQGNIPDPEFGWGHTCDEFTKPVALLGPHAAPLGIKFYTGTAFPAEYRGQAFIARHGSWNKSKKIGGDIVVAKLNKDGTLKSLDPFLTGFLQDNNYVGRPVDLLVMKDGSLLISDDYAGAIYRVSYGNSVASH